MYFSKTSTLATIICCSTVSGFASATKPFLASNCETINIVPQAGQVELYLSKDNSLLGDKSPFTISGYLKLSQDNEFDVSGVKVEILKKSKIDSFQKASYGWSVTTTDVTVYGVKLRVSADYVIGYEIQGDVGMPVKSIETYAICYDRSTYVGQP